jgi:hypothetical protein
MGRRWTIVELVFEHESAAGTVPQGTPAAPAGVKRRYRYDVWTGRSFVLIRCRVCNAPRVTRACAAAPGSASYTERCERCAAERARDLNRLAARRYRKRWRLTG